MNMYKDIVKEDFDFLKDIFLKAGVTDFKIKQLFNKIEGYSDETEAEIMLRINKDYITIARINILKTRQGIGSSILDDIIKYCNKNNIKKVIIESAFTREIINFANKKGFTPDDYVFISSEGLKVGNYILNL